MHLPGQTRYDRDALVETLLAPGRDDDRRRLAAALADVDGRQVEGYEVTAVVRRAVPGWTPLLRLLTQAPVRAGADLLTAVQGSLSPA